MYRSGNGRELSRGESEHCRWNRSGRSPRSTEIPCSNTVEVGVDRGGSTEVLFSIGILKKDPTSHSQRKTPHHDSTGWLAVILGYIWWKYQGVATGMDRWIEGAGFNGGAKAWQR